MALPLPTDPAVVAAATDADHAGWHNDIHANLLEVPAQPTNLTASDVGHLAAHRAVHAVVGGGLPLLINERDPGHRPDHHLWVHAYVNAGGRQFRSMQEYYHDGGTIATNQTTDLKFDSATFKAVLTSGESTYLAANHPMFAYFCLPQELIKSTVPPNYTQTLDASYPATMAGLVSAYGPLGMYQQVMPEWDNDPGNNGWANNRFSEAGVGGARPDLPTGLTRQQAYDQFMHFYQAAHHGGITDHHQLGTLINPPWPTRGWKTKANCVNAGTCHYAFEMGLDLVTLQRNNDDIAGLIGSVGFLRGAAAQYLRAWGYDISHSRTWWGTGTTAYDTSQVLTGGWTVGTYKRSLYLCWATGCDLLISEAANFNLNGATTINGRTYNPFAVTFKDFNDFAVTRHPFAQRGRPHVPVAILKDHITLLEPRFGQFNTGRFVWYFQMAANAGENMLFSLLDTLYPNYHLWGSSTTTAEPWGTGKWGEQFDVLTDRAGVAPLSTYPAVLVATNATVDATLQAKLDAYARAGGLVVLNAKQLGTGHETLTGVTLGSGTSGSGTITWEPDSTTTSESTFNYTNLTLGTATRIARLAASTPMVTKNLLGSGEVWVVAPDWMSIQANTALLGLGSKIIDELVKRSAVATISGGSHASIDYAITKGAGSSRLGVTVTIINTHSAGTTWTGTVSIPEPAVPYTVREWIADATPSSSVTGGQVQISASVPGNDAKVYAVVPT